MKKLKFFLSFLKERDWLEEMAARGWILTDISFGMLYHFKKAEPCQKVFELERFGISAHPTIQELNARKTALDIAVQSGWEVITHDEDMNYYFMKNKAGDETDEFYDDEESRKKRAERYYRHYTTDQLPGLLATLLITSMIYILIFLIEENITRQVDIMWFYIIFYCLEIAVVYFSMLVGKRTYRELSMTREEWENRKHYSEKKSFKKIQQLRVFLQKKNEQGLSFTGYENGYYLFEEDTCRYNYFVDTKSSLKKRLKEHGLSFTDEKKDWNIQSPKWYEMSIAEASQHKLIPVGVIKKDLIIYKRPFSEESLPWENDNENLFQIKIEPLFFAGLVFGFLITRIFL